MQQDIEIEIRGPLPQEKYESLKDFLEKNGTKKGKKERVLIDYSSFLEKTLGERKKDIRLRVTNGRPEIIVKLGAWSGSDSRRELSVITPEHTFDTLVEIFGAMGFIKGVLCVRNTLVYDYKGIEFALVEVPGHSYFYEAEKMASSNENSKEIMNKITQVCTELGISIFSDTEFFNYIEILNREANEVFDFTDYELDYFKNRFNL